MKAFAFARLLNNTQPELTVIYPTARIFQSITSLSSTDDIVLVPHRKMSSTPTWNLTPLKLNRRTPVPSDIEVVRDHKPKRITQLAQEIGLKETDLMPFGHYVGKIDVKPGEVSSENRGKYVVVTGINPTPLGEGKSTTAIGLAQCLSAHLNRPTIACLRQPSQGPTFGIKGGAAGGEYSTTRRI